MPPELDEFNRHEQFLRLFLAAERELIRYVMVLVPSVQDASEIVQQTALLLWKRFDEYDSTQPFTPWACRFGLNVARQWMVRHRRWAAFLDSGLAEELLARRNELRPEFDQRLWHLESCLEKLPPEQHILIQRYYRSQEDVAAISQDLCQSVQAIYKTLQRVRKKLRACIDASIRLEGNQA